MKKKYSERDIHNFVDLLKQETGRILTDKETGEAKSKIDGEGLKENMEKVYEIIAQNQQEIKELNSRCCAICNDTGELQDAQAWDSGQSNSGCPFCPDTVNELLAELQLLREKEQTYMNAVSRVVEMKKCSPKFDDYEAEFDKRIEELSLTYNTRGEGSKTAFDKINKSNVFYVSRDKVADFLNNLKDISIKYHGAGQLRARISSEIMRFLKETK
jgi:phage-related minor tail protein